MKDEKPTPGEEAIIDGLRSIFYLLDERLPKEEPAWKRDGIIPTLQGSARTKEAEQVDDATNARYEREDAEARQGDPDEALARVLYETECEVRWEGAGAVARDTYRDLARAAREHIEAERDVRREVEQEAAEGRIDALEVLTVEQQRRAEKAETELNGWKAKHAAFREDVEACRNACQIEDILDRDAARDPYRAGIDLTVSWEPFHAAAAREQLARAVAELDAQIRDAEEETR